jgi:hydrogenase expression/formation protein HypC
MCLAIPGKIVQITNDDSVMCTGKVSFGGILKDINLAYVPEAGVDDYVIVHAGFALTRLDEAAALQVLDDLESLEEIDPDADRP